MGYREANVRLHPADIINLDIILIENLKQCMPLGAHLQGIEPHTLDPS